MTVRSGAPDRCSVLVIQSCPTLRDPMDCSPPGSSVHGILQARIVEWVAIPFSRGSSQGSHLGIEPGSPTLQVDSLLSEPPGKLRAPEVKLARSCLTLCNPMDYTVHGILQARILEWVAIPFSRGFSQPRDQTRVSCTAGGFFTSWATREAQEYWSGWPIPSPGDLPDPGIEPGSPTLQADSLPTELSGKPGIRAPDILAQNSPFSNAGQMPPRWLALSYQISSLHILNYLTRNFKRFTSSAL